VRVCIAADGSALAFGQSATTADDCICLGGDNATHRFGGDILVRAGDTCKRPDAPTGSATMTFQAHCEPQLLKNTRTMTSINTAPCTCGNDYEKVNNAERYCVSTLGNFYDADHEGVHPLPVCVGSEGGAAAPGSVSFNYAVTACVCLGAAEGASLLVQPSARCLRPLNGVDRDAHTDEDCPGQRDAVACSTLAGCSLNGTNCLSCWELGSAECATQALDGVCVWDGTIEVCRPTCVHVANHQGPCEECGGVSCAAHQLCEVNACVTKPDATCSDVGAAQAFCKAPAVTGCFWSDTFHVCRACSDLDYRHLCGAETSCEWDASLVKCKGSSREHFREVDDHYPKPLHVMIGI